MPQHKRKEFDQGVVELGVEFVLPLLKNPPEHTQEKHGWSAVRLNYKGGAKRPAQLALVVDYPDLAHVRAFVATLKKRRTNLDIEQTGEVVTIFLGNVK